MITSQKRTIENARTQYTVTFKDDHHVECVTGGLNTWKIRLHFHIGDEVACITAGKAKIRFIDHEVLVREGDVIRIPAGVLHRFEPVDDRGWSFFSEFIASDNFFKSADSCTYKALQLLGSQAIDNINSKDSLHTDLKDIARSQSLSLGYLARHFKKITGTTLHNFHVLSAYHSAKALLRQQTSIIETAAQCGFYDQAHLNREFIRTAGMTPKVYRDAWMTAGH